MNLLMEIPEHSMIDALLSLPDGILHDFILKVEKEIGSMDFTEPLTQALVAICRKEGYPID